ncbi:MAG: hypothetical protein Q4D54_02945 [Eubacteriales bacterium]|nr:hypothetical protein [Lachnospiraceae bacterium]MDO5126689.1 hypothetical protein [Eubacteriales bacterium]
MSKKICMGIMAVSLCLAGCGAKAKKEITGDATEVSEMTSEISGTGSYESIEVVYQNKYKICYKSKNMGHPSGGSEYSTDCGWNNDKGSGSYIIDYYVTEKGIESDYPNYSSMEDVKIANNTFKIVPDTTNFTLLYKIDDDLYLRVEVQGSCQLKENTIEDKEEIVKYYIQNGYFDQAINFDIICPE